MRQERRCVFETNSSSTHSICITKNRNSELAYPTSLRFRCDEYGWGFERLNTPEDKASYLYSSFLSVYEKKDAEKAKSEIWQMLGSVGVECEFDEAVYHNYDSGTYCVNASVDHAGADDHAKFVNSVIRNKGRLLRYLFSEQSFVLIGNDNGCDEIDIVADYPHEEYYKGN